MKKFFRINWLRKLDCKNGGIRYVHKKLISYPSGTFQNFFHSLGPERPLRPEHIVRVKFFSEKSNGQINQQMRFYVYKRHRNLTHRWLTLDLYLPHVVGCIHTS